MKKRGQVTIFVIIALIILIVLGILFFGRSQLQDIGSKQINVGKKLESELNFIEKTVNECLVSITSETLTELAHQGGYLNPSKYLIYDSKRVPFLCQNIPDEDKCLNSMLVKLNFESQIESRISGNLMSCINIEKLKRSNDISTGNIEIRTKINKNNIVNELVFPVTIRKGNLELKKTDFKTLIESPLGEIIDMSNFILNQEASSGNSDLVTVTLKSFGRHIVELKQPYPHKLYIVSISDDPDYKFYFAVEGET